MKMAIEHTASDGNRLKAEITSKDSLYEGFASCDGCYFARNHDVGCTVIDVPCEGERRDGQSIIWVPA